MFRSAWHCLHCLARLVLFGTLFAWNNLLLSKCEQSWRTLNNNNRLIVILDVKLTWWSIINSIALNWSIRNSVTRMVIYTTWFFEWSGETRVTRLPPVPYVTTSMSHLLHLHSLSSVAAFGNVCLSDRCSRSHYSERISDFDSPSLSTSQCTIDFVPFV